MHKINTLPNGYIGLERVKKCVTSGSLSYEASEDVDNFYTRCIYQRVREMCYEAECSRSSS